MPLKGQLRFSQLRDRCCLLEEISVNLPQYSAHPLEQFRIGEFIREKVEHRGRVIELKPGYVLLLLCDLLLVLCDCELLAGNLNVLVGEILLELPSLRASFVATFRRKIQELTELLS